MEEQWLIDLRNFECEEPDPIEFISLPGDNPFKGREHTAETRKLMSISAKNRPPVSEETRRKNSKPGELNGFYGKKHSAETCKRMSEAAKGNKRALGSIKSEETRAKLSAARLGKKATEETKKKKSLAIKGRKWYNNGVVSKMLYNCPDGWIAGRK